MKMPDGSPQRLCAPGCRRGCSYHLTRTACADFRLARLSTTCGTIPPNAFEKFQNLFLAKSASFDVQRQLGHSPSAHGLHLRYDYLRELQAFNHFRVNRWRIRDLLAILTNGRDDRSSNELCVITASLQALVGNGSGAPAGGEGLKIRAWMRTSNYPFRKLLKGKASGRL